MKGSGSWATVAVAAAAVAASTLLLHKPTRRRIQKTGVSLARLAKGEPRGYIFFDMDDTLVATTRSDERAYEAIKARISAALAERGVRSPAAAQKATEQFAALLKAEPWDPSGGTPTDLWRTALWQRALKNVSSGEVDDYALASDIYFQWKSERLRGVVPLPGVDSMLIKLRLKYGLALVTNGDSQVQHEKLSNWNGYSYFDAIVISGDEPHAKPHKHMFETALQRCGGTDMGKVVMVGDSISADIKGAQEAGCLATIYVNIYGQPMPTGEPRPDYVTSDILSVSDIIDNIFASISDLTMAPIT